VVSLDFDKFSEHFCEYITKHCWSFSGSIMMLRYKIKKTTKRFKI